MRQIENFRFDTLEGMFPGWLRAEVVETNDPLNMGRIRFKCPELHDYDLSPDKCPWAVCNPSLGGPRSGSWVSPCIGDQIWINFEKDHPYGPIWTGAADPTRRKMYPLASIHTKTPLPVDKDGELSKSPEDYTEEYLPKDGRPMSTGKIDRYGNLVFSNTIGFFPQTHDLDPGAAGYDALQKSKFEQTKKRPEVNNPDTKYMVQISKYGHILQLGDVGYWWQKPKSNSNESSASDSKLGEFVGSPDEDDEWEVKRWKYFQRLLNEDEPKDHDQRKIMLLTRYGHLFEARDVGWNKSRDGEYDDSRTISKSEDDQRWMKMRTKGGMLFQMSDMGCDPEDEWVNKLLVDEVGVKRDEEDTYWKSKDARWMRLISRHGFKFVIDDRGSDDKSADVNENPRGNGILIKGRRSPGSQGTPTEGDERGFYWEFNENDDTNQTTWGTPLGQTVQLNDRLQYCLIVAGKRNYSRPFKRHKENEFLLSPLCDGSTEKVTHHMKLDHHNEYVRLKTRAGNGSVPFGDAVVEVKEGEQQGLECRDGVSGDGPWVELVDVSQRGLWFWDKGWVICRAKQKDGRSKIEWWFNESQMEMVFRNGESGYTVVGSDGKPKLIPSKIQIYCAKDVEIIAAGGKVDIKAGKEIILRAGKRIVMQGGGARMELSSGVPKFGSSIKAPGYIKAGSKISLPKDPQTSKPPRLQPEDRGKRYNSNLDTPAKLAEIEHPK